MTVATPFAAIEQSVNAGVLGTLANAVAVVAGEEVAVIFDRPYADAFDGQIDAAVPECIGPTDKLGGLQRESAITVDGTAYRVLTAEPDGTGMTRLVLYTPGA